MEHRGEIIKNAIYQSGMPISAIAKQMGKSRRWFYQIFEQKNVTIDTILTIGKIIHYDFTQEIKEMYPKIVHEPPQEYPEEETVDYWKNKYIKLLEAYNSLLLKNKDDL
ncbi:MAG: helix-turn-helix domain-containing protein [Flavobacterium sp.]|jgi:predicted transcriptional regulator|uniref:helix-turn-helix domain-containing protein n=1 Tax=Flavobacterium sp. TaxID=239 RepID=UPI0022C64520|nr:helix-turn-helix domain-containing protein [Flavobacterium sp.]MCZ8167550.1 helix-turn-helix domain containing protein [Flavobacterium sp.]MCZ8297877.1 helix-turn-helix domain containing protein [Flavobacterium sp.]